MSTIDGWCARDLRETRFKLALESYRKKKKTLQKKEEKRIDERSSFGELASPAYKNAFTFIKQICFLSESDEILYLVK